MATASDPSITMMEVYCWLTGNLFVERCGHLDAVGGVLLFDVSKQISFDT